MKSNTGLIENTKPKSDRFFGFQIMNTDCMSLQIRHVTNTGKTVIVMDFSVATPHACLELTGLQHVGFHLATPNKLKIS